MTLQEIKRYADSLEKNDFQNVFFYMLNIADSKYGMSFFIGDKEVFKDKLLQFFLRTLKNTDKQNINKQMQKQKQKLKHIGSIDLNRSLDDVNIREFAYE